MPDNRQTIEDFYSAFARLDADRMNACYAPDAAFDDEAFCLRGATQVGSMWRMLCDATRRQGADVWKLTWRDVRADAHTGRAHWDAHYRLSSTGRIVDNSIDARFTFTPEGLIATHRDSFDFWAWSRQALGPPGLLLGWTPFLKKTVRARAARTLAAFNEKQP
ncbi:MAG: nuclear transport factor 2 family protein [Gammaproteobacteria bacterium]|nr:nuclear transport factor 2 family protein [Gammaproteobacteria bacterium]MBU1440255.1 nuclear transport factor 2 family protein [Gammaproteobacteria bacterium]MBU2286399.1 nuclear transport factor 2 family protein [Gammaproteobacteria bacterium]MBU2407964.1 nuclear transport factor 2 family protein [Gammaproteobacteria bacterium]